MEIVEGRVLQVRQDGGRQIYGELRHFPSLDRWVITVSPVYRRKGLATRLLDYAVRVWGLQPPSEADCITPEGLAFVRSWLARRKS